MLLYLHYFCACSGTGSKGTAWLCRKPQGLCPPGIFVLVSCSKEWLGFLDLCLWNPLADAESHIMGAEWPAVCGASSASAPKSEMPLGQRATPLSLRIRACGMCISAVQ